MKKIRFPKYTDTEFLDGLKHLVLKKRNPSPAMITAVSDSISKVVGAQCKSILARADARIAVAQEKAYKENSK